MKKIKYVAFGVVVMVFIQSCSDLGPEGSTIPTCEWDTTEKVVYYDLALKFPSELSLFHKARIPSDMIGRTLWDALDVDGDAASGTKAEINGTITSNGRYCVGRKTFKHKAGSTKYTGSTIDVPFVSNTSFLGEVTIGIKTDVFVDSNGNDMYYHVTWSGAGNDPNGNINGNLTGTKFSYGNLDGTTSILYSKDGSYIKNGEIIYL
jgi:hypothetical protein